MAHAEKCLICNGSGQLEWLSDDTSCRGTVHATCHGCGGKGWVTVPDDVVAGTEELFSTLVFNCPVCRQQTHLIVQSVAVRGLEPGRLIGAKGKCIHCSAEVGIGEYADGDEATPT